MKILIEEKDETQQYRPIPVGQFLSAVADLRDRVVIYLPNCCGGETRVSIFKTSIPEGNIENRPVFTPAILGKDRSIL